MAASEIERFSGPQTLNNLDGLNHSIYTNTGSVELDTRGFIVVGHPTGTNAKFDPATRNDIKSCDLFRECYRVSVVNVIHQCCHSQSCCRLGRHRQSNCWRPLVIKMVGTKHCAVAQVLYFADRFSVHIT